MTKQWEDTAKRLRVAINVSEPKEYLDRLLLVAAETIECMAGDHEALRAQAEADRAELGKLRDRAEVGDVHAANADTMAKLHAVAEDLLRLQREQLAAADAQLAAMRPVVEAAERMLDVSAKNLPHDHRCGTVDAEGKALLCPDCFAWHRVLDAVDAYRAGTPAAKPETWGGECGGDMPLPEDDAIAEAYPTRSGRHDLYAEAMRMVGAKRSKGQLVMLVNWLLLQNAKKVT